MRRRLSAVMIAVGCLLVIAAAALVGYNLNVQQKAEQSARTALEALVEYIPERTKPGLEGTGSAVEPETEPVPDYMLDPRIEMPTREIDGVLYIGYLTIPSLDLELPIISETTYPYLKKAPCRFAGSAYLDDLVIGAHNYTRHFGRIDELAYGDIVQFTDMDGNVFTYEVASVEILQPHQGEELCSGEWPLTLYTCTIGGRTRVTVRCDKV